MCAHFPPSPHNVTHTHTHTHTHARINRDGGFPVKDDGYNVGPTGGGTVQMGNLKVV